MGGFVLGEVVGLKVLPFLNLFEADFYIGWMEQCSEISMIHDGVIIKPSQKLVEFMKQVSRSRITSTFS